MSENAAVQYVVIKGLQEFCHMKKYVCYVLQTPDSTK